MSTDKNRGIPSPISDSKNGTIYLRRAFLGKGAFRKCFKLIETTTNNKYAGKIGFVEGHTEKI